ncbi:MAG TPA: RNA ligase family protein, partial [Gaiellales bacterium]|nr:RNA ligase family protein [Gaiellales bacterium]
MTEADPFRRLSVGESALLRPAPLPETVEPMKAVLTEERFSDPAWVYERKLDGIRCIAIKADRSVRLLSRNNLSMNARFPGIAAALEAEAASHLVLDGEVVAFSGGRTSFELLQQRTERRVALAFYVFDLLHLAGHDTTALPLHARRRLLRGAVAFQSPLRLTPSRKREGERLYAEACRKGWEGLIAKRVDAPYTHGRSRDWLKFKCTAAQELVIGGYTAPRGSRSDLGALLLGHFE